jgi:hypothetical protein
MPFAGSAAPVLFSRRLLLAKDIPPVKPVRKKENFYHALI